MKADESGEAPKAVSLDETRRVYAHFMVSAIESLLSGQSEANNSLQVGIVGSYQTDNWINDIQQAKATGIDGFGELGTLSNPLTPCLLNV